jgi:hypothetical protein
MKKLISIVFFMLAVLATNFVSATGTDPKSKLLRVLLHLKLNLRDDVKKTMVTRFQQEITESTRSATKVIESKQWETKVIGQRSNYNSDVISVFSDDKVSLMLDHARKLIVVQKKVVEKSKAPFSNLVEATLDNQIKEIELAKVESVQEVVHGKKLEWHFWLEPADKKSTTYRQVGFIISSDSTLQGYLAKEVGINKTLIKQVRILKRYRTFWSLSQNALLEVFESNGKLKKLYSSYTTHVVK